MYKIVAEKIDFLTNVPTDSREYQAVSFTTGVDPRQHSGDVTLEREEAGLHTVIQVGGRPTDWQYVRIFDARGIHIESLTYANERVHHLYEQTADRP